MTLDNTGPSWPFVDAKAAPFLTLGDRIWDRPEVNFQEHHAAALHAEALAAEGFSVRKGVAGMPTAIAAEAGQSGPVIAILGEYDALPGLSQKSGIARPEPVQPGGHGHGCGHNLLGAASLLAATALKDYLAASGIAARIRYYGCPAEEGGSAKGFMVRAGLFDDVDAALCWHPAAFTGVNRPFSLACVELEFRFTGRSAHAGSAPHLGRSALDAVELMHVGVNYMREHMLPTSRIHYALIDGGGFAPNVVQASAMTRHMIRAASLEDMWALVERVKKVAEGAAMMSETSVSVRQLSGDANLVGNSVLEAIMHANLQRLGGPGFDAADREFAGEIQQTLSRQDILTSYARFGLDPVDGEALSEAIYPLGAGNDFSVGSTDVGTVSWVVPTVQCRVACYAIGTPGHSWQLVAQGKMPAAHKGVVLAAKAMASTAADLLTNADLLQQAHAEHDAFRARNPFTNPVVDGVEPSLAIAAA